MSNKCNFCISTNTNILVLNNGSFWVEFCKECGDKETLTNNFNKTVTLNNLFKGKNNESN